MAAPTIYSGPGKVVHTFAGNKYAFHAYGTNGEVMLKQKDDTNELGTATFGYRGRTKRNQLLELTLTPFDLWALLPVLYPPYLGISTNGGAGALKIGTRPHDIAAGVVNGSAASVVWTPDTRSYTLIRSAITQPPSMRLGVGQPLYEAMKITGLWDPARWPGIDSALTYFLANAESGAADPDVVGFVPDIVNGRWLVSWGNLAGFQNMEVEDYWKLSIIPKFDPINSQGIFTRHFKLASVEIQLKGRLQGPSHTQIFAQTQAQQLGALLGQQQAVTAVGPSGKTITINDAQCIFEDQGPEFGGTKGGTGEITFITQQDFGGNPGQPQPIMVFGA